MNFYPLKLKPVTKSIIWGGDYLKENFGFESNDENIAEAWVTTCRNDGDNIIENGKFANSPLSDYIRENDITNICGSFDAFPLLIKLIDANDRLSVQVHPDDEYAKAMSCFKDIVKNAVPIETHADYMAGTAKEEPDLKQVFVLMGGFVDGESIFPVLLEVKERIYKNNTLYMAVLMKKIESLQNL